MINDGGPRLASWYVWFRSPRYDLGGAGRVPPGDKCFSDGCESIPLDCVQSP